MPDGSIIFDTELDNSKLQKQLKKLKSDINKLESSISAQEAKKSPLVQQAQELEQKMKAARVEAQRCRDAWKAGLLGADKDQAAAVAHVQQLEAEYAKVEAQINKIDDKLIPAYNSLDAAKEEAGGLEQQLAQAGVNAGQMDEATKKAQKSASRFALRMKEVVRSALVFTVISQALASFREWTGKVIRTNEEATAAVAKLKGALLTLAQPLVDVLIPAFTTFVNILTDFINAASRLVSFLLGTTVEESAEAAEKLNEQAEALDGIGSSAKKAEKALASFDEINKLTNNSGGSGGSSISIAPDFSALKKGLTASLAFTMEDILFDWEDLTAEDILAKIVTGLSALAGALIGFAVGGPGGAAIGFLIGAGVGLVISDLLFNGDGKLYPEEILKTLALALGTLAGGILGFVVGGGIGGAALGITLGAGVALALCSLVFNNDGVLDEEEVLSSAIVALGALVGGIMGFALGGGIVGAKIGATIGAGITLSILGLFFDGDGQLDPEEIKAALAIALGAIAGAVIGFVVLPGAGAAIGAIVGAGITAKIVDVMFEAGNGLAVDKLIGGLVEFLVALAGGLIGFFVGGGPVGGVIGAAIGVGLSLIIDKAIFSDSSSSKEVAYEEGKQIGDNVLQGANDSLGINSPSTEFAETGGYMMEGMANGITANSALPIEAFKETLTTLQSEFTDWNTSFSAGFSDFGQAFASDWVDLWKATNMQFVYSWNNILDNFQSGVNNAISALNKLVAAANELDGLTGKHYSYASHITVSKLPIPKLAQGAVIPPNREFLAVLGDQKSGTNIETPLSTMVQAFKQAMAETGGGGNTTVILELDGQQLGKVVFKAYNQESRRVGVSLSTK